jgi:hypothetical protein
MMDVIRVSNWVIEVDPVETNRAQAARSTGSPESCGCLPCRNFVAARPTVYSAEFADLLARLGVPLDRESEIWHGCEVAAGRHSYGGWFHFVGQISDGPDCLREDGSIELAELPDGISIGFTRRLGQVPETFPVTNIVQLEFSAEVPWVLKEPCSD